MKSIWSGEPLPDFPQLWGDTKADVLIIGGGMAGLLCAYRLTKAGISCIVAEQGKIAGGTTSFTTAKLTAQHGLIFDKLLRRFGTEPVQQYLMANLAAIEEFAVLAEEIDCDFSRQDSLLYARTGVQKLETELYTLEKLGYPGEFVRDLPLPFPTIGAIRFPDQAQFHPRKFLRGIVPHLTIYEDTGVKRLDGHTAYTENGRITFSKAIVATHFPFLNRRGMFWLKLCQNRSYVVSLEGKIYGMYLDASGKGLSLRGVGDQTLLGGFPHRTGKRSPGWEGLETVCQQYFPQSRITGRWAAQDCMSLDDLPYVGQYSPATEDLYVATGFNKWGMTGSMVASGLLCNLIQGKDHPCRELLSPQRQMLRPQLFVNGWEAAANLIIPRPHRCTHMGCSLCFNRQEGTYDCPCHGSRYRKDGKVIDGPAQNPLPRPWRRK